MNELDKELIKDFWSVQSLRDTNRWTNRSMIEFETSYLRSYLKSYVEPVSLLDLGSGSGYLSRTVLRTADRLIAVDFEPNFQRFFDPTDNQYFQNHNVVNFLSSDRFDLILLFGVVTHLTAEEEVRVFSNIKSMLKKSGMAVIKHQVSRGTEIFLDTNSEELGCRYQARYPSHSIQTKKLTDTFGFCHIITYPEIFNKFPETMHVAYVVAD